MENPSGAAIKARLKRAQDAYVTGVEALEAERREAVAEAMQADMKIPEIRQAMGGVPYSTVQSIQASIARKERKS